MRNRKIGHNYHWVLMLCAAAVVGVFLFHHLNVHSQHIEVQTIENSSSPLSENQNVIEYPSITQNKYLTSLEYSIPQTFSAASGGEIEHPRGAITETPNVSVEYCVLRYSSRMYLSENKKRLPPILYSFPGAGNTWSRLLIEYATGKEFEVHACNAVEMVFVYV